MTILDANVQPDQTSEETWYSYPPLIAVFGPTASGKSRLALRLAQDYPCEIVNADSRSFYRGMDIGTAKPSAADRSVVPHHLVDILDPANPMSLAAFEDLAMSAIREIHRRRRIPLLVGGTPQYINAIVEGWVIPRVAPDPDLRRALEQRLQQEGVASMSEELRDVDPVSADRAGVNSRRIIRALEVYRIAGQPMSALAGKVAPPFHILEFELCLPREVLHQRIARRVHDMVNQGLANEVRSLLDKGVPRDASSFLSIGYRQMLPYLDGEATLDQCISKIIHDSNRLVRHQQTWFRKNRRAIRIDLTDENWYDDVIARIDKHFRACIK